MTAQEENEFLAEKLLDWVRVDSVRGVRWRRSGDSKLNFEVLQTPTFRTGNDMLMLLEAFVKRNVGCAVSWQIHQCGDSSQKYNVSMEWDIAEDSSRYAQARGDTAPEAVRAAAIAYLAAT